MWQPKTVSLLGIAMGVWSCGQTPETTVDQAPSSVHRPSSIVQLVRPKRAIGDLSTQLVDRTVRLEGIVQQQAPLLAGSLYLIADETGEIWVRSDDAPPTEGTPVIVEGRVHYEQIVTGGTDISEYYLRERSRSPSRDDPESP